MILWNSTLWFLFSVNVDQMDHHMAASPKKHQPDLLSSLIQSLFSGILWETHLVMTNSSVFLLIATFWPNNVSETGNIFLQMAVSLICIFCLAHLAWKQNHFFFFLSFPTENQRYGDTPKERYCWGNSLLIYWCLYPYHDCSNLQHKVYVGARNEKLKSFSLTHYPHFFTLCV